MTDLLKTIQAQRGTGPLAWVMRKLPGFKGYEDMEQRRAADTLLRHHITTLLKAEHASMINAEKAVLNSSGLSYMSKLKDAKAKLQVFIDRVATANPGYAGFFDAIKVGPNELNQIYNFDADLLDYVDLFKTHIAAIQASAVSKDGLDKAIEELNTLADQANNAFKQRENVLTKL